MEIQLTGWTRHHHRIVVATVVLAIVAAACSGEDEPEVATTPAPAPAAAAPTPTPASTPAPTTAAPVELTACQQFFVDLDALAAEFVQLVDDGNRSLLLTIGQETSYEDGEAELTQIAARLREISTEVQALGDPPQTLASRVNFVVQAVDQFAEGYQQGAEAAALPDVVALNQSLGTVSRGTPLLQAASESPASCP
jgi:hypothetical protein